MGENVNKTVRKFARSTSIKRKTINDRNTATLNQMFEQFMGYKETEGLTDTTLQDYHKHFRYLLEYTNGDLPKDELSLELFRGFIGYMLHEKNLSPVTANVRIRTMRAFVRHCFLEGWIEEPIHERFKPVKTHEDTLESFTPNEIKALIGAVDDSTFRGFRDLVVIYVLLDTMIRCTELIQIKRENVDLKTGFIQLEPSGTKTKKARLVPLSTRTVRILDEYMTETFDFHSEMLFVTYEGKPLADNTVRKNLQEWGKKANIQHKRVSPHTFRHTGALFYVMNGGDPFSLQKILGHTDMSMVRKYIQMTNTDIKAQHNQFSPISAIF
ncbi:tyrosine-type recombinase/integrase [Sediminibacillus albus]|uniref:Integrase/recombinase XerD n=1 Tax=Sediminibacillus albus TaxID=407036 RepID=A0A1G8WHD1_9BACI|nr:tyrosine-type recombinase/integrase [Sediminibacillus albus]SDJ77085.1 integrase/recombinase XerD [Sediminibacillus albus]